jgi:hypothetical protein
MFRVQGSRLKEKKFSPQRHREHREYIFSLGGRRRPEKTICRFAAMVKESFELHSYGLMILFYPNSLLKLR